MEEEKSSRFEHLVAQFLERKRILGWSPRTLESYRYHLSKLLTYLKAETDICDVAMVTPDVLHCYQLHLYGWTGENGRGLSLATQAGRLSAVRSFFRFLVKTGVLQYDPAAGIELPKRRSILPRTILSRKEVAALLGAPSATTALGRRDRAMLEVFYSTGIRNAELRALMVEDLDLEQGLLRVNQGKGARDRIVPLGTLACFYLRTYLTRGRPRLVSGHQASPETPLFVSRYGRPLQTVGVINSIRKYAHLAGISRPVTPHTLRHTFATHLLEGRADLRHIQAMMGHASVATTQIYTRLNVTDLKAVHRRCHPRERQWAREQAALQA